MMADIPTVTIPRVLYDVLVGQAQANAKAPTGLLGRVKASGHRTPRDIMIYRDLTGTNTFQARRELDDWVNGG